MGGSSTHRIVVMGVSGAGKSWIGERLAQRLGVVFVDGDDYHSTESIEKMAAGVPLSDEDRRDWLNTLAGKIESFRQRERSLVVACSALKARYRDILRSGDSDLVFLYLQGDREQLLGRLSGREHFFRGAEMLDSQLLDLEPPTQREAVVVDCTEPAIVIIERLLDALQRTSSRC